MELLADYGVPGLFLAAFLAATVLPLSSELVLSALVLAGSNTVVLVVVATLGNVLGALVNYCLGLKGGQLFKRRFKTLGGKSVDAALARYQKWGAASLLLAWAPVIGDPLTLAAGVLRVKLSLFLTLVTIGKAARYTAIAALLTQG